MTVPEKFTGYGATSQETWKDLKLVCLLLIYFEYMRTNLLYKMEFEPKPFEEYDVDIKIEYCGVCGSDLHTLRSGWVRFTFLSTN
jgi:alcohol dehydrogenase (NADP+)